MHSYSTDVSRVNILCKIAGLSLATYLLLTNIFNNLIQRIVVLFPYLEDKASSLPLLAIFVSIFSVFYIIFDKKLWNFSLKGTSNISMTPDLSGEWSGHVITDYNGRTEIDIRVKIEQTWTSMTITLETEHSRSKSLAASILTSESRLVYYYFNEPRFTSTATMHKHYGVTTLDIIDENRLEGQYFTCRDRKTYGEIYLKRCV